MAVQQSQDCLHASGLIGGRSALAILLWTLGTLLLIATATYLIVRWHDDCRTTAALLLASAGAASLLSCTAQYGPSPPRPRGLLRPGGAAADLRDRVVRVAGGGGRRG